MGTMNYTYWFMMHAKLKSELKRPTSFVGFRFTNVSNTAKRAVYLGPCTFYKEDPQPLTFEPWPEELPFPTRPETILPTQKLKQFTNSVSQRGDATVFHYRAADGDLAFRIRPGRGGLADIEVVQESKSMRPCSTGGVRLAAAEGSVPPGEIRLKSQRLSGGTLEVIWAVSAADVSTEVTYRYRLSQKSLIVDVEASDPVVDRLVLGRAEPVTDAKLFRIPYLTYGGRDPCALYADGLFFFELFDWFVSNASALLGDAQLGPGWAAFNGCAQYIPKTDGRRNLLRERLFLTVSPDFREVLPTIPNPPSPWGDVQGERLWRTKHGSNYQAEIREATRLRNSGCDKVTIRYHEETWRDAGESYTFRTDAAPGRGGDEALKGLVASVQALGWRVGLYTNYTDFAPVNARWDEDWVLRRPDGSWSGAWSRCYAPKPMRAVEAQARLAPLIHAKFGENHSYCDVHTAVTPFSRVDYDARVPGAGAFRRTFECFGRILCNEKIAHHGPVYSEGRNHWWYAGLADGNYAQVQLPSDAGERLLVDFDLLKMHPLSMDAGMTFRGGPKSSPEQTLACTIAYGHIGILGSVKTYYMLQQTAKRYAMVPVRRIAYERDGQWLDTSTALVSGAVEQGRVRVEYENGTEVTVNGSPMSWRVQCGSRVFELPQWGFVVRREEDGLLTYAANVFGAGPHVTRGPQGWVDCSLGTNQFFAESSRGFAFLGPLGVEGGAALKKDWGGWWVIPTAACTDFAFLPSLTDLPVGRDLEVAGIKEDGSPDPSATRRWSRGTLHVIGMGRGCQRVEIRPIDREAPPVLACETTLAVAGERVSVGLPKGVEFGPARWEAVDREWSVSPQVAQGRLSCLVPTDVAPGQHLWLRLSSPNGTEPLWLDFVTADAVETALDVPGEVLLGKGGTLPVALKVTNNLARAVELVTAFSVAPQGECIPSSRAVTSAALSETSSACRVLLPWADGETTVTARIRTPTGECVAVRTLNAALLRPTILDLAARTTAYTHGYCPRGKQEVISTGRPHTQEGSFAPSKMRSGGVAKTCLFSHPPYGKHRAGYVFAIYKAELPEAPAAQLDFFIGMRGGKGFDPSDGVTFKVIAIDSNGRKHGLFAEHYAERKWKPLSVSLALFAGQSISLKLIADCGPKDNTIADHGLWGEPRVVLSEAQLRVTAAPR